MCCECITACSPPSSQVLLHRNGSWLKSAQKAEFLPHNHNRDLSQTGGGNSLRLSSSSCSTSKSILQPARLNLTGLDKPDLGLRTHSWASVDRLKSTPLLKKRSPVLDGSKGSFKSLQLKKKSCSASPLMPVGSVGVGGGGQNSPGDSGKTCSRTVLLLLILLSLSLFVNVVFLASLLHSRYVT